MASGDPDLIKTAENLQAEKDLQFPDVQAQIKKDQCFRLFAEIDTDMDFTINKKYELELEFFADSRQGVIDQFEDYIRNKADYDLEKMPYYVKNSTYFKDQSLPYILEQLKTSDNCSTGANWELSVDIIPPKSEIPDYAMPKPKTTIGGVDYEWFDHIQRPPANDENNLDTCLLLSWKRYNISSD